MHIQKTRNNHSVSLYIILLITAVVTFFYTSQSASTIAQTYDNVDQQLASIKPVEVTLDGSSQKLYITDQSLFTDHSIWSYVGPDKSYPDDFTPLNLVDMPVEHSKDTPMKMSARAAQPLKDMFIAAEHDGYRLIVASAYRSIDDQTKLYGEFVDRLGPDMANNYISVPGKSEHHSGLAIDIDDYSADCELDSNVCYISLGTAEWLANNAYKFGFILRYPEGKQPITDMAYESWHYRYVGVTLATALTESGLTLDEFIAQVAPGRINGN